MHRILTLALLLAAPASARPPSLVPADAPELAAPGPSPVGTRELRVPAGPGRALGITLFYPAAAPGAPTSYPHRFENPPAGIPAELVFEGIATTDAAPAPGPRLPTILLSHGLGRWSTAMSGMAENLASKGYFVASIDHDDRGAMNPGTRLQAFATSVVRRSQDQRAALAWLKGKSNPLATLVDPANVAVIGYSMGGFGALATGGAGHARSGTVMSQVPAAAMASVLEPAAPAPGVRAVVLIAPWGGAAATRSFTPAGLSGLTLPSLWIMGDQDDVAGADGIRWLHDNAVRSDRRLLVFANARHNLGGNPPPASAPDTQRLRDAIDEPVWRKDMADAIIFRSLTAFLDLTLKGDASRTAWLDAAADGSLKGFAPRWQLGLTATHTPPSPAPTKP
ncbi:alpha/beta hydrolase family protein [Polymorphobacter fuscus]|uniref:Dienelactone hydrolase n=1 Tax=Sandarakinorhabdus fusca TaxID=1439888 RepID=A0A7C9LFT2_9SPHN|nr:alpha/beta hydrolase [Polymorphobacter fuscus]KAB7647629.1 dienelactone hydrolase [Polymorphobacter fuscus]MQT16907.1 dienelactone hydrolase [Polymorphobacter fuscus]